MKLIEATRDETRLDEPRERVTWRIRLYGIVL